MELKNETVVATEETPQVEENNEGASLVDFKMVTFSLAEKDYSIDIMHVKEIAKAGRFTYVPNTLPFVLGVYNLRGEIIPILDLRLFFNIEIPERDDDKVENMLILSVDDQKFGVVVDKIDKVVGVQKSTIQPPHPLFGDINIKYIDGVVEANNRLYILLDVTKIFSTKEAAEIQAPRENHPVAKPQSVITAAVANEIGKEKSVAELAQGLTQGDSAAPAEKPVENEAQAVNLKFVKEALASFSNFYVSSMNESWITHRYSQWTKDHGENAQLTSEDEAKEFLKPFWSACTDTWWTKEFADSIEKLLPDNSAKQVVVWNPGCGKGIETYSLACVLRKRYPTAKIRVYAQDVDLLSVSNATLVTVPESAANDWYGPYLTKKANGDYTFNQEIKDSIMFEYHDCKNTNALPMVDIVFARDVLSLLDENSQETVVSDFIEKMKGNAIAVIGDNESMPASFNFSEKTVGTLVAYSKD